MERFKKHPYLTVFCLCFILGLFIVLPSIIAGGGAFAFIDDFNQQQMPFNVYMNEAIKSGNVLYDFHNDLGASFIGSYSFYNVGSPFVILLWLFPSSLVPYLLGPMYALKYAIAGLTAFLFLNRFVKNKKYALLGSILYSFSGFQFVNMLFYHFHDAVAFFPLLLYGLDCLIKDNKKGLFALAVVLNLLTNYFFFIGQVVFVFIYYVVLNITKYYHFTWKKFGQIALESILGVCMGCVLLVPSILFVISNPRVGGTWTLSSMFLAPLANILEILRALIFPSDNMTFHSAINMMNYSSLETFLPLVGSVLWLTYLIKKPKDSFSVVTFVFILFMLCPILNSSFFAFTTGYYARWIYMLILLLSLLSIKTLDEQLEYRIGFKALMGLIFIFVILSIIYVYQGNTFSYQPLLFLIICFVLIVCMISLYFILRSQKMFHYLLLGVCIYTVCYGNYTCFATRIMHQDENGYVKRYEQMKELLVDLEDDVRYNHNEKCERNSIYYAGKMSITSWNSNIEGNAFTFYQSIGVERHVLTKILPNEHDLQNFLSVKYIVMCRESLNDEQYKIIKQNGNMTLYENLDYLPLGIPFTSYIKEEEFNRLSNEEKKKILKETVILKEEQIQKYQTFLKPYESNKISYQTHDFKMNNRGFTDNIKVEEDSLLVYTIPYSDGFKAMVNGKEVSIERVDNGLMGIPILKGQNEIEFIYYPKGLSLGISLSSIGLCGFGIYMFLGKKKILV